MRETASGSIRIAIAVLATCWPLASSAQYTQHNLVSDGFVAADHIDPDLINPWGISLSSTSFFWVANQGSSNSTLYNGGGVKQSLVVDTPFGPTGTVFNGSSDFVVSNGTTSGPARFLFAHLSGEISAWNPTVDGTHALTVVDHSASGSVFTGMAIQGDRIYTANFSRGGVDMFNSSFGYMGSFSDSTVAPGFSPFNVQAIGTSLFVQYAKVAPNGQAEIGAGGYVDEFDRDGHLIRRFASNGVLDAPWGVTMAPSDFGPFSNMLLVGNFGNGRINAFDPVTGAFAGTLSNAAGAPIENEALWGITFGNGGNGGNTNSLYFAAGIGGEQHGLFGRIDTVPEPASLAVLGLGALALLRRRRK